MDQKQLDLFSWADSRPSAVIIDFVAVLIDQAERNADWYASDAYLNRALPERPEVVPLRRRA